MVLKICTFFFPWVIRRKLLNKWFGFKIDRNAHIGLAWIFPKELVMSEGANIGHFTIAINLDKIEMGIQASIGRQNWITGFPTKTDSPHFTHQPDRKAELIIGAFSAVTKKHHLDCTNQIIIGHHCTIAGYDSQFLTHSIDIIENRQSSSPIHIGHYTFVGTNVVVLGGAQLPDYCVLGAKSLLNKKFEKQWTLYGGVPARETKTIPADAKYFSRIDGFVY